MNNNTIYTDHKRSVNTLVFMAVWHAIVFCIVTAVFFNLYRSGAWAGDEFAWEHQNLAIGLMCYIITAVVTQGVFLGITGEALHKYHETGDTLKFYAERGIRDRKEA